MVQSHVQYISRHDMIKFGIAYVDVSVNPSVAGCTCATAEFIMHSRKHLNRTLPVQVAGEVVKMNFRRDATAHGLQPSIIIIFTVGCF